MWDIAARWLTVASRSRMPHLLACVTIAYASSLQHACVADDAASFRIAPFQADVTPPLGHPLQAGVGLPPAGAVADPLLAHGFALLGPEPPIVVCSVDWCGIGNTAHDAWRRGLAEAAGTTPERVLVCAIHQHDAPLVDFTAEEIIADQQLGRSTMDVAFHEAAIRSVAAALTASLGNARPVTHLGTGQARVERVASTRRILGSDGTVAFVRGSASRDPRARIDPEGLIDPFLKTLSFWNGDTPIASLSVYATHPMSFYGKGQVSADFAGLARRRRQADEPGVLHFYANGCGGDLAPGKYNDGSPTAREELAERLYAGWRAAWDATRKHELKQMKFRSLPIQLPVKNSDGFREAELEAVLRADSSASFDERVRVAYALSWRRRHAAGHLLDLPIVDFGVAQLLLIPGEPFVEYQLFAQAQRPDSFVMTLGYGDYGPVYIPTDRAFAEGGYEPGAWSFVAVGVEQALKETIARGLLAQIAQPPKAEQGYYAPRSNIVGVPQTARFDATASAVADTRTVLQNLRMSGVRYPGWSAEQADAEARTLREQGYNAVIGGGHRYLFSDDPNETLAPHVYAGGTYQQLLRDSRIMADACHKHGLKFFLHQTCTMIDHKFAAKHPDWATIDIATGQPHLNGYGTPTTCLNNDEFMTEFYARLRRLLHESNADGLLQDEIQFFGPTLCGCHSCRDKFQRETGFTIPTANGLRGWLYQFTGNPSYARWLAWRREKVNSTLVKVKALVQEANPDGVVINYLANPSPTAPYYMAGYTIDDFPNHSDIVGYECEPPQAQYLYFAPLTVSEMKYQRAVAESMQTGLFRLSYSNSPGEHLWNWCLTKSQGSGDWWVPRDDVSAQLIRRLLEWDAQHDGLGINLTSAADIGVLFSLDARDRHPKRTATVSWLRGYQAVCRTLTDGHIPHKALTDRDLAEPIGNKVRTLLLFNNGPMSDRAVAAVRQFVKEGGLLIASNVTSLFDEHGDQRTDFGLADVFGCHFSGESTADSSLAILPHNGFTRGLAGTLPQNFPFTMVKELAKDVQVLGEAVSADGMRYPGVLTRPYGTGRVIYFSGYPELLASAGDEPIEPGKHWTDHRDPRYVELIRRAATSAGRPMMTVKNLPEGVVAEAYQHEQRGVRGLQVRLANLLGGRLSTGVVPTWYGASFPDVASRLPAPGQPIEITVRGRGIQQVVLFSPDFDDAVDLPFESAHGFATVQLPTLARFSLIYFVEAGDVLSLCSGKKTLTKTIPPAKELLIEESQPLVGAYDPQAVTVFAGSESVAGGTEPSVYLGEMCRFIYGSLTQTTKLTVTLDVTKRVRRPILELGGLDAAAPLRITLNNQVIFEGPAGFGAQVWTVRSFPLEPESLRIGKNVVVIENTGEGPVSAVPWFGLSFIRLRSTR